MIDTDKYEAAELEQMIHDAGYPEVVSYMIDTDKYEGHTPAPWSIKTGNAGHSVKDANGDHVCTIPDPIGMCNKHIIADAPLLLAEVKRLREIEREWKQMWSKLEDYPDMCAELICFMESEEE